MVARIICPLGVYYAGGQKYSDLARCANVSTDTVLTLRGDYQNALAVDALEYAEISCSGGATRRLCTRTTVFVPWTPILFAAVRREHVTKLQDDLNSALIIHHGRCYLQKVKTTEHDDVSSLVRSSDRILWSVVAMSLYELRFDSYYSRSVGLNFMRDNAHSRANDYTLFASIDSICVEIALASYIRGRARGALNLWSTTTMDTVDATDDDRCRQRDDRSVVQQSIDVSAIFEMGVWCRVNDSASCEMEQYIRKLTPREITMNQLSEEPWADLPVVSYDLETVARLDSTLPRGVERDQRLSSVAITIHHRDVSVAKNWSFDRGCDDDDATVAVIDDAQKIAAKNTKRDDAKVLTETIVLAHVPVATNDELIARERQIEKALRRQPDMENATVMFFRDERALLYQTLEILTTNEYFADLYELDDPADAERIACVLIGYNCWSYDYTYLQTRAVFHGMYKYLLKLVQFHSEPRYCRTQLSFDLMLHVKARYAAQIGSVALKNVSRYFGATDAAERGMSEASRRVKMQFDAVSIRRMYFGRDGEERFDAKMAFDDLDVNSGVNMLRVLLYNARDCTAVYYLMQNMCFMQTVLEYSRHFFTNFVDASHAGNSRLLPNAFTVRALQESNTVLPYRDNKLAMFTMPRAVKSDRFAIQGRRGHGDGFASASKVEIANADANARDEIYNVMPCAPYEMREWYQGERSAPSAAQYLHDQLTLMRIDDDKVYVGGINSATAGHYA